jgi:hypothetical protein
MEKTMLMLAFLTIQTADTNPTVDIYSKILGEKCRTGTPREDVVVVCGRRDGQNPYRIGPQPSLPPALPDAEFRISENVKAKLGAEQGDVGGIPTNRAMITLKLRF